MAGGRDGGDRLEQHQRRQADHHRQAGGSALAHPWPLRALALAGLGILAARMRGRLRPPRPPRWTAIPAALALVLLSGMLLTDGATNPRGDMLWHEGWIRQVAGGVDASNGLYEGVPNAYPWLYHALAALLMTLLGIGLGDALTLVAVLMLLLIAVGAWLLCAELGLHERARRWAAVLVLAGAGLDWLLPADPPLGEYPDGAFGHLLASPQPTPGLANVPPPLPRDLGLALIALVLWLGARWVARGTRASAAAAGAALGLAALAAPPSALAAAAGLAAMALARRRGRGVVLVVAVAAAVFAVWAVPLAVHASDLGGLVTTTRIAPTGLDALDTLVALAPLLALAIVGLRAARGLPAGAAVVSLVAAGACLYLAALLADGDLLGSPAFAREVRHLPAAAVLAAPAMGIGAAALTGGRHARAVAAGILVVACTGTVLASVAAARTLVDGPDLPAHCSYPGGGGAGRVVALLPGTPDDEFVQLDYYSRTGSWLLWAERPRVRFADPGVPGQPARRAALHRIEAGARPPAGVDAVVEPRCTT